MASHNLSETPDVYGVFHLISLLLCYTGDILE